MNQKLITAISQQVFVEMGKPGQFSRSRFSKEFQSEIEKRGLGGDTARYRYLFTHVSRAVELYTKKPPRHLPPSRVSVDFKKLAANDRE